MLKITAMALVASKMKIPRINLTIDPKFIRVDFLKDDAAGTVNGSVTLYTSDVKRLVADGTGWRINNVSEQEFNFKIWFASIVKYNTNPIGATTYADITAAIHAAVIAQAEHL